MQASYLCLGFPEPSWVAISLQWWKRDACRKRAFMIELQYFCHLLLHYDGTNHFWLKFELVVYMSKSLVLGADSILQKVIY